MSEHEEAHKRLAQLLGGYTAFIAALLVATVAKSDGYSRAWVVISLLALSLPSLIAFQLLDYHIRVGQKRSKSMFRGLALGLGFLPSLAAIALLIGHFSVLAGALFLLLCVSWLLVIDVVVYVGYQDKESDV